MLIAITIGAARRHPPSEAEVSRIVDDALADAASKVVSIPDIDGMTARVETGEAAEAETVRVPEPTKPAAVRPAAAPVPQARAAAITAASTRPEPRLEPLVTPEPETRPVIVRELPVERPAEAAPVVAAQAAATPGVTISGCVEESKGGFILKNVSGDGAPKSRSWKSGFLRKGSSSIVLIDEARTMRLASHVGQRVETTGVLDDREMRVKSLRVQGSCD